MRAFFVIVAVFCVYLVQADFFGSTFTAPLFMWSNTQYFVGKNVEVNEYTAAHDVANALIGQENSIAGYLTSKTPQLEVIFVFIEPELRTEQFPMLADAYSAHPNGGAFSNLKGTMESYATSSISIPYTHVSSPQSIGTAIVTALTDNLPAGSTITLVKDSASDILSSFESRRDVAKISKDQLKTIVAKEWQILSNGVVDVVIVCFDSPAVTVDTVAELAPSFAADDAYMHDILHSLGSTKFLALFTADSPAHESIREARSERMVEALTDTTSTSIYPPGVIEAQIVLLPFLFILFTGIYCTCSLQSDLKFDAEKKTYGRKI